MKSVLKIATLLCVYNAPLNCDIAMFTGAIFCMHNKINIPNNFIQKSILNTILTLRMHQSIYSLLSTRITRLEIRLTKEANAAAKTEISKQIDAAKAKRDDTNSYPRIAGSAVLIFYFISFIFPQIFTAVLGFIEILDTFQKFYGLTESGKKISGDRIFVAPISISILFIFYPKACFIIINQSPAVLILSKIFLYAIHNNMGLLAIFIVFAYYMREIHELYLSTIPEEQNEEKRGQQQKQEYMIYIVRLVSLVAIFYLNFHNVINYSMNYNDKIEDVMIISIIHNYIIELHTYSIKNLRKKGKIFASIFADILILIPILFNTLIELLFTIRDIFLKK